jgi:hypothetical protein
LCSGQPEHQFAHPDIKAQLKCTFRTSVIESQCVAWSLERANDDQLRLPTKILRIVVAMLCSPAFTSCFTHSTTSLAMLQGAY